MTRFLRAGALAAGLALAAPAPAQTPLDQLGAPAIRDRVAAFLRENPRRADELLAPAGTPVGIDPALIELKIVEGKPVALNWPYRTPEPIPAETQQRVAQALADLLREALEVYRVDDQALLLPDDRLALERLYKFAPATAAQVPPPPAAPAMVAPAELLTDLSRRLVVATAARPAVVAFAARLPGVPVELVRVEAVSGNVSLIPSDGLFVGPVDADGSRTLTITPVAGALGIAFVTVRVIGPAGIAAATRLTVQVGEGYPLEPAAPLPVAAGVVPPEPLPMGLASLFAPGYPLHGAPGWSLVWRPAEYGGSFPFYVGGGAYCGSATTHVNPWAQPGIGSTGGAGTPSGAGAGCRTCLAVKYNKATLLKGRSAADAEPLLAYGEDHLRRGYPAQAAEAFAASAELRDGARTRELLARANRAAGKPPAERGALVAAR